MRLRVSSDRCIKALRRAGFKVQRTRGSHTHLHHPDGRRTTVPRRNPLGPGLLAAILRQAKLSREEFQGLLGKT